MQIPSQLIAGDTATWTDSLADYPADDSWVLKYRLTAIDSTGGTISLTAAASGSDHVSTITAATSAVWVPGSYSWAAWVEGAGSTVFTVGAGIVTVLANPRTAVAGYDPRTPARQALDECDAALRTYGAKAYLQSITVGDRAKTFRSPAEFLSYRSKLQAEVAREENAARVSAGLPSKSQIRVRFPARS